jgi:hypothetical protein
MVKQLCDIHNIILRLRLQFRFGRLSRAPLRLLRLEWRDDHVDCDWIARAPDEWDQGLSRRHTDASSSAQALEDAMAIRELLFNALHEISSATFRVYRQAGDDIPELIITGTAIRSEPAWRNVDSLVMRAKLCGFRFCLDKGKLMALPAEGQ